jgi:negative regulator of genetic competence, sporulation and motility
MTACCPDCGKSFASAGPLAQHIQAKHPNVCIVCNKSFGSEISLNQHTVDTHGTGNIFHFTAVRNQNSHSACCPDCGKSFASAGPLAQHIQAKHANVCIVCNKSFRSESSLNQHTVDKHGTGTSFTLLQSSFTGRKSFGCFECEGCSKQWSSAHAFRKYKQGCQACE